MRTVIGNQQAQTLLERAALAGQVSHAYLLTGPDQIGKRTLALAFVQLLECTGRAPDAPDACGECVACRKIEHGNHPDVAVVVPPVGKVWLPIESIRDLQHMANLAPYEGRWRAFVLPRAERMLAVTMNALLKTLEEPPPGVVLLLTSAEPDLLLPTLLSRCQLVALHPLAPAEITAALVERQCMAPGEAATLAGLAGGRMGWALEAAAQPELRERRDALVTQIVALATATRDARLRLVAPLASDTHTARVAVEAWTLWWRDVLLAAHGVANLASGGAARAAAERLGSALGAERAEAFLRRLLLAHQQLEQNANPRLALEVLALDMPMPAASRPGS
ncbi:MAG TPA: DNA polymerase III subunit [Ktedonobacterales bacterium]|nr:DNA polymerase III subunit [Ktedonobacterales bacterium]